VLGDVLTLPALYLATFLLGYHFLTPAIGVVLAVMAVVMLAYSLRSRLPELRRIARESLPILTVAGTMSVGAGLALASRFDVFSAYEGLFVLELAHLSSGGALGGILSGRLSTKMLLGTAEPSTFPSREARRDIVLLFVLAVPVYLFNGLGATVVTAMIHGRTPGVVRMVGISLAAGLAGMGLVVAISYTTTVVALRNGLDPDNFGIPVVSSMVDFFGAIILVIVITLVGIHA
jgi:mgtE-like transporter